jgi:hypothetical protein
MGSDTLAARLWRGVGTALRATCFVLLFISPPARAAAEDIAIEIQPTKDAEVDLALRDALNLPILISGGAAPTDHASAEWGALIEVEQERLSGVLQSFGYLQGRIRLTFVESPGLLQLATDPGPLFRIAAIQVVGIDEKTPDPLAAGIHGQLASAIGAAARGDVLSDLADGVLSQAHNNSFPFAKLEAEITADSVTETALIRFAIELGPFARWGAVTFDGRSSTIETLSRKVTFAPGDPYDPQKIRNLEAAADDVPLLRRASVDLADHVDADGLVSVNVSVSQNVDPAILAGQKLAGIAALGVALAILSIRQFYLATRRSPGGPLIMGLDIATLVLVVVALTLVAQRVMAFAKAA